jgi:hypothetical protein
MRIQFDLKTKCDMSVVVSRLGTGGVAMTKWICVGSDHMSRI